MAHGMIEHINYPRTDRSAYAVQALGHYSVAFFEHRWEADHYARWLNGIGFAAVVRSADEASQWFWRTVVGNVKGIK